jgi:hypothetical protein
VLPRFGQEKAWVVGMVGWRERRKLQVKARKGRRRRGRRRKVEAAAGIVR